MLAPMRFLLPGMSESSGDLGGGGRGGGGCLPDEQVIDGEPVVVASEAQAAGGVGLGVAVDEEGWEAFLGEGGGEIDGGGGLSDAALLVYDGDDFAGSGPGAEARRRAGPAGQPRLIN